MIITIDGPTASGKSTTAQLLAKKLSFYYLNSGFLYRALAYLLMRDRGYTFEMLQGPADLDVRTMLDSRRLRYSCDEKGNPYIEFDGKNITAHLKGNPEIDQAASIVSVNPVVREILLELQRAISIDHDIVIDGRDTGSVVFPYADFKFYLTAPLEVRAARWVREQYTRGNKISLQEAVQQLAMRDERDMTRKIAPLIVPQGSLTVDNGAYTLDETVDQLYRVIKTAKS